MKTFGTLDAKDYNVEEVYVSAPISWELLSGSGGILITSPTDLEGAITFQEAENDFVDFRESITPKINEDTGTYKYVLYRSIKHLFYNKGNFLSGSVVSTSSLAGLPDKFYVVSIGQNFYGERIKPGSFELSTEVTNKTILDDNYGNLYVSESGVGSFVGNIFYENGVAVIKMDTGSVVTNISTNGLKLVANSNVYLDYSSDLKLHRHEAIVNLFPNEFNFSPFNPSILNAYKASGSVSSSAFTASMQTLNMKTSGSSTNTYNLYNLMGAGVIKPYVTSIGLYNDKYELLAVAKMSEPIQRTFDTNQIFIVRFDT